MYYTSRSLTGTNSSNTNEIVIDDDEDYLGFESPLALNPNSLLQDQGFQEALRATPIGKKPSLTGRSGTSYGGRLGTGAGRLVTGAVPGTGRTGTALRLQTGARPLTAMRAAGYSTAAPGHGRPPAPPLVTPTQDSVEEKIKQMEAKIIRLIEESCALRIPREADGITTQKASDQAIPYDPAKSLAKAQEASALERQLQRLHAQAGTIDSTNMDLSFTVTFNLSCALMRAGLPAEALSALHSAASGHGAGTGGAVPPAHAPARRGLLAASAHLALGEHRRALKLYRMALDGTPATEKDLKLKIMHNIGLLLVRMGKFRDAVTNFQHMMHEGPDFTTGLHLVLCEVSLGDLNGARAAFQSLLHVDLDQDLDLEEDLQEKFLTTESEDASSAVFLDVLRADKLSTWAASRRAYRSRCVLRAARAISLHDPTGLEWCAEALRTAGRVGLAAALEGGAAARALRGGRAAAARAALRRLGGDQSAPGEARAAAACNLAFLAFAEGDIASATKLSEEACLGRSGAAALVVRALCSGALGGAGGGQGGWGAARGLLVRAVDTEPGLRDPHYYLGLACEKLGLRPQAAASYALASRAAPADPLVRIRQAFLARSQQDTDAAIHWYHQVLADFPHDTGVLVEMARMYEEAGDLTMAQHCYLDADAIFPGMPEVAGWLGSRARAAGEPAQAMAYYRRAALLSPNQVTWSLQEAGCLRAMGKHREALAAYTRLHQRHPDNIECLQMLVKLSGSAGSKDAERWAAELQRARRTRQATAESPLTIGSGGSSRGSSSPGTNLVSANRGALQNSASSHGGDQLNHTPAPPLSAQDSLRRMVTSSSGRKASEDEHDLPLPPD